MSSGIDKVGNSSVIQQVKSEVATSQVLNKVKSGVTEVSKSDLVNKVKTGASSTGGKIGQAITNAYNYQAGDFERVNLDEYLQKEKEL